MNEKQSIEVISLRHRLRALLARGVRDAEADGVLDRMGALSRECGDTDLRFEHARWRAYMSTLDYPKIRQAS